MFKSPLSLRIIWISGSLRTYLLISILPRSSAPQRSGILSSLASMKGVAAKCGSSATRRLRAESEIPLQTLNWSSSNASCRPRSAAICARNDGRFFRTSRFKETSRIIPARARPARAAASGLRPMRVRRVQEAGAATVELVDSLNDGSDPLAHANTHGRQATRAVAPLHLMNQTRHDARAAASERMPQRDRPAINVDFARIHVQLLDARERLRREGLVQLDQVDVVNRQTGAFERFGRRRNRSNAHERRMDARNRGTNDAGQGL